MIIKARFFCLMVLLAFSEAGAQSNEIIYSNTLQNGWADWSWASDNLSCTSPVLTGFSDSISVSCGAYTALALHVTPFESAPFTNVTLWLNGVSRGAKF
jgi:hypothetical protein